MSDSSISIELEQLIAEAGLQALSAPALEKFAVYFDLFQRWNQRTNLSAIRDREGILRRHFLECVACAQNLPETVQTLLDFGSGGGFPGIPIAICRPAIAVTLSESQGKKAAFLQEAVRVLGTSVQVYSGRAENLAQRFDCVALRAVDHMVSAVKAAALLVSPSGYLALMTTETESESLLRTVSGGFERLSLVALPGSTERVLALVQRQSL